MNIDFDKYRELYLDAYLHFACGPWPNSSRYNLQSPWVEDGWKYATDGRILMAVPTQEANSRLVDHEGGRRYPRGCCDIIRSCFGEWADARPWPTIGADEVILLEEEENDYIVLDWDQEIVSQPYYYWMVERLSQSINRQLEFRIAEIEYRIADSETAVQFRTTKFRADGQRSLVGVLMLCLKSPQVRKALDEYHNEKKKRELKQG